jgi:homogentisate 1,2-dioxygenase
VPFYIAQGNIPSKRHICFKKKNGDLFREELFSTHGFSDIYSNKYHHNMPSKVIRTESFGLHHGREWKEPLLKNYKAHSRELESQGNFFSSRKKLLFNDDCAIYIAHVTESTDYFYRNAYADEVLFIHDGKGFLLSEYGELAFKKGDYLIIPRGTTYQLFFENYDKVHLLITESFSMVRIPKHFRTESGQLLETAPYCERDIRHPILQDAVVKKGHFPLIIKYGKAYQKTILEWHPYDLEGWDGAVYPWAINIDDYAPVVGKIHLPPSAHLLLTGNNFVICNFVPRLYDFHPESIPAPYYHSNIDSDEVLYYVKGDFMSRTDIHEGSMTLHRKGIPHGPQPGKTEASLGKKETNEYAVMLDTFSPLKITQHFQQCMDVNYNQSWLEE